MTRKRQLFIDAYGPVAGPKLYHALQSQAAHAGVSARLRRKIEALTRGERPTRTRAGDRHEVLPLFPDGPAGDAPEAALADREPAGAGGCPAGSHPA